jgi:Ala-tRNA(Pro) deacylase
MVLAMGVAIQLARKGVDHLIVRRGAPPGRIARSVLIEDARGYALAVVPADREIDLQALNQEFRRTFRKSGGTQVRALFPGVAPGAIPPVGVGDGMEVYLDDALVRLPEVYLETGERGRLARLDGEAFRELFYGSWCGTISRPAPARREPPRYRAPAAYASA